jgi:hypothetical protein
MANAASTTLAQLGGSGRLSAMINAKHFMSSNDGQTLTFKFSGCRKANCVQITLNSMDTYDVEFVKISRKLTCSTAAEYSGIYADNLKQTIEQFTGLYLSL